jgi:hypothetical protein
MRANLVPKSFTCNFFQNYFINLKYGFGLDLYATKFTIKIYDYVAKTLPTLKMHLDAIQKIHDSMK